METGYFQKTLDEQVWIGEFDLDRNMYVGVRRSEYLDRASYWPRKHTVWAKDELEAYTRLTLRKDLNQ